MAIVKPGRGRKAWLGAKVRNGKLTIEIGVETLAFAAQRLYDDDAFDASEGLRSESEYSVVDPDDFAQEIVRTLQKEAEDGTTEIHLSVHRLPVRDVPPPLRRSDEGTRGGQRFMIWMMKVRDIRYSDLHGYLSFMPPRDTPPWLKRLHRRARLSTGHV